MEVKRNSFADARINGYLTGLLQRFSDWGDSEMIHALDRTEDYILWFEDARKAGFNVKLDLPILKDFCIEDFTKGFLFGWKGGYNNGHFLDQPNPPDTEFTEIYKLDLIKLTSESVVQGCHFGSQDGTHYGCMARRNGDVF